MNLEDDIEILRCEESQAILDKLDKFSEEQKAIYLDAYSDALSYIHKFLKLKLGDRFERTFTENYNYKSSR